jgi:hypothetical protein
VFVNYSDMLFHGRQYDDAYITYRYAVNLAEGWGLVFNSDERVNRASSFLYTVLPAGFYALGLQELERVAAILGLARGCLLIAFTAVTVFRITAQPWLTTLLLVPLFLSGAVAGWAVRGTPPSQPASPSWSLRACFRPSAFVWPGGRAQTAAQSGIGHPCRSRPETAASSASFKSIVAPGFKIPACSRRENVRPRAEGSRSRRVHKT